ncbi:hypothetical protein UFOVP833_2 [uncultured Caudovirales phage]|uniref:Uncharacterized protein n=1 Tax=uncultured Caudovirales phage TaxID=2100421 RepID=A0A6J5P4K1_9CAUD|nr:hypothetical protein UFOVP833_2 [uncultured Caudovirales phage]CAB4218276.1 hypothetical protein UFOVP1603_23 [uncultured Caudovirales phage]
MIEEIQAAAQKMIATPPEVFSVTSVDGVTMALVVDALCRGDDAIMATRLRNTLSSIAHARASKGEKPKGPMTEREELLSILRDRQRIINSPDGHFYRGGSHITDDQVHEMLVKWRAIIAEEAAHA